MNGSTTKAATQFSGRVLMSVIFLTAGVSKIGAYAGTQAYMESMGVPGAMLPLAGPAHAPGTAQELNDVPQPEEGRGTGLP